MKQNAVEPNVQKIIMSPAAERPSKNSVERAFKSSKLAFVSKTEA